MILLEFGTLKKVRTGVQQDESNESVTSVKTVKQMFCKVQYLESLSVQFPVGFSHSHVVFPFQEQVSYLRGMFTVR